MNKLLNWESKLFLKAVSFPLIITLSSFIPELSNHLLFIHAGPGWFLLFLNLPWVLGVLFKDIKRQPEVDVKSHIIVGISILIIYLILSYPLAFIL
jgi:hypothetical protein